jgi:hypothetical protein
VLDAQAEAFRFKRPCPNRDNSQSGNDIDGFGGVTFQGRDNGGQVRVEGGRRWGAYDVNSGYCTIIVLKVGLTVLKVGL